LTIAHLPKRITADHWDGPKIPVSPDAIEQALDGLADHIGNDVLRGIVHFILGAIEAALSIAGVIDIDVWIKIDGSYAVDFDPANSTSDRLSFRIQTALDLTLVIQVFFRLGICPLCIRIQLGPDIKQPIVHIDPQFQVDLFWEFDSARNEIRIRDTQVHGSGIIGIIGAAIMEGYVKDKIKTQKIDLPQEFSIKKLKVTFPGPNDPDVTIGVVVALEKLDWA
jgi:hypothetical protein